MTDEELRAKKDEIHALLNGLTQEDIKNFSHPQTRKIHALFAEVGEEEERRTNMELLKDGPTAVARFSKQWKKDHPKKYGEDPQQDALFRMIYHSVRDAEQRKNEEMYSLASIRAQDRLYTIYITIAFIIIVPLFVWSVIRIISCL